MPHCMLRVLVRAGFAASPMLQLLSDPLNQAPPHPGRLACQLAETGQRLAGAEAERDQLRSMLDAERGTAFVSLNQFQKQQARAWIEAVSAACSQASLH